MALPEQASVEIEQIAPNNFVLTVLWQGQRFGCGTYLSRGAAMQAATLFAARKEAEQRGQKKRPQKKR